MTPRYADVRWALERYPDVTSDERNALWQWYGNARAADLLAVLNDPALEKRLQKLHRDYPHHVWARLCISGVILAAIAIAVVVAA